MSRVEYIKNLVNQINPEEKYWVSYTIDQSGNKHFGATKLKGKDLTEAQILERFEWNGALSYDHYQELNARWQELRGKNNAK